METAENVRMLFVVALFIVGVSHIVQGRIWGMFFTTLAERGTAGAFTNALIHLVPGLLIVGFHPVYQWPYVLFTALGWAWVVKSAIYLVAPDIGVRQMAGASSKPQAVWIAAGLIMLGASALLAFSLYKS